MSKQQKAKAREQAAREQARALANSKNSKVVSPNEFDIFMIVVSDNILDGKNKNLFPPLHAWLEISQEDTRLSGRFRSLLVFPLGLWTNPIINPTTKGEDLARKGSPETLLPWAVLNAIRMRYLKCSTSVLKSMGPVHM